MNNRYRLPTDRLTYEDKELLRGYLNRFKVELEIEIRHK